MHWLYLTFGCFSPPLRWITVNMGSLLVFVLKLNVIPYTIRRTDYRSSACVINKRHRIFHSSKNWRPGLHSREVTCYKLDGSGIESWWGSDFPCHPNWSWGAQPIVLYRRYWIFPRVKWPECVTDHPPPPSARLQMGRSYTSADPLCLHSCVMGWLLR